MQNQHTVTASIGSALYRTEISNEKHLIISDESAEVGGGDQGLAPTDLLASSLAACTAITLRMYANRKELEVTGIDVKVSVVNQTVEKAVKTLIKREIVINGNLTDEQRQRMLQIANVCPIHKTLTNPIEVVTELGESI
ncbi:MAG: OsmC family protein [Spirosomataceae bacterium]